MFITDQSLAVYVIAPVKTDTSELRPSHSTRVKECSMEHIEFITSVQHYRAFSSSRKIPVYCYDHATRLICFFSYQTVWHFAKFIM